MTSQFILAPGEEFIQCPYNTAHQITNARLITHLAKCRSEYLKSFSKTGQKSAMRICRHNSTHHYPAPEIRFHEDRCRDAISLLRHVSYHYADEGNQYYEQRRKQDAEFERYRERKSSNSTSSSSHSPSSSHSHSTKDKYKDADRHGGAERSKRTRERVEEESWETESTGGRSNHSGRGRAGEPAEEDWKTVDSGGKGKQPGRDRNYSGRAIVEEESWETVSSGGRSNHSGRDRTGGAILKSANSGDRNHGRRDKVVEDDWEAISSDDEGASSYKKKDRAVDGGWDTVGGAGRSNNRERDSNGIVWEKVGRGTGSGSRGRDRADGGAWEPDRSQYSDQYRPSVDKPGQHRGKCHSPVEKVAIYPRDQYRDRRPSVVDEFQPQPGVNVNEWGLEEEDWEAECSGNAPGYDPQVKLRSEPVIYNPQGLTKSERKQFRHEVREKLAERELHGEPVEFPTPSTLEIEVKSNIKDLTLNEKVKKEPKEREPGELSTDDDEDAIMEQGQLGAACNQSAAASSSTTFPNQVAYPSYNNYRKPNANSAWDPNKLSDEEPDSDDFGGYDPY